MRADDRAFEAFRKMFRGLFGPMSADAFLKSSSPSEEGSARYVSIEGGTKRPYRGFSINVEPWLVIMPYPPDGTLPMWLWGRQMAANLVQGGFPRAGMAVWDVTQSIVARAAGARD